MDVGANISSQTEVKGHQSGLQATDALLCPPTPSLKGIDWTGQAVGCIASTGRYVTTINILTCLLGGGNAYELLDLNIREQYINNLSVSLNGLCKAGYICKVKIPAIHRGNYYGLPEWFETDGSLKREHIPTLLEPLFDNINHKILSNKKEQQGCSS